MKFKIRKYFFSCCGASCRAQVIRMGIVTETSLSLFSPFIP